jgi:hypothetical protein
VAGCAKVTRNSRLAEQAHKRLPTGEEIVVRRVGNDHAQVQVGVRVGRARGVRPGQKRRSHACVRRTRRHEPLNHWVRRVARVTTRRVLHGARICGRRPRLPRKHRAVTSLSAEPSGNAAPASAAGIAPSSASFTAKHTHVCEHTLVAHRPETSPRRTSSDART